jgi:uncharacterized membrane protein YjjB (DUF3815 family)
MNSYWIHIIHQAIFGGIASAGFGVLFNCPPRIILHCMGSGAMALAIRTGCQFANLNLPESAFFAALAVATAERTLQPFQQTRGSIIALVGSIPMVPGSTAAKGLTNLFALLQARPGEEIAAATSGMRNLLEVTLTLAAIGIALAIPQLIYPEKEVSPKIKTLR